MTNLTETVEAPKGDDGKTVKAPGKGASLTAGFLASLAVYAIIVFVAGVALNRGFQVHVPFMAGWLLLIAGGILVKNLANSVAGTWHAARILADIDRMAATMAANAAIQQEHSSGLAGLLAKFDGVTDTDNGGYL